MSKGSTTEKQLFEAAGPRYVIDDDRETALACARDREALQVESLGDWARYHDHDYTTVFKLWCRRYLWPRRRDRTGLLKISYSDALRAVLDEAGDDTITPATLDALEREHETTD